MNRRQRDADDEEAPPRRGIELIDDGDDRTVHVGTVNATDDDATHDGARAQARAHDVQEARAGRPAGGTLVDCDNYCEYDEGNEEIDEESEGRDVRGALELPPDDDDDAPRPCVDEDHEGKKEKREGQRRSSLELPPDQGDDAPRPHVDEDHEGKIARKKAKEEGQRRSSLEIPQGEGDDAPRPLQEQQEEDGESSFRRKAKIGGAAVTAPPASAGGGRSSGKNQGQDRDRSPRGATARPRGPGPHGSQPAARSRRSVDGSRPGAASADLSFVPPAAAGSASPRLLEEGPGAGGPPSVTAPPNARVDIADPEDPSIYLAQAYVVEDVGDDDPPPASNRPAAATEAPPPAPVRSRWWENKCLVGAIVAAVAIVVGAVAIVVAVALPAMAGGEDVDASGGDAVVLANSGGDDVPNPPPLPTVSAKDPKNESTPAAANEPAIGEALSTASPSLEYSIAPSPEKSPAVQPPGQSSGNTKTETLENLGAEQFPPTMGPTGSPLKPPSEPLSKKPSAIPTRMPRVPPTNLPSVNPTPKLTLKPTLKPTAVPTTPPTRSPVGLPRELPTARPTPKPTAIETKPLTDNPTRKPTLQPTLQPTRDGAPPANKPTSNDRCEESWAADVGLPASFTGTTIGANPDFLFPTCGIGKESRGVWYTFEGKGRIVRIEYALDVRGNGLDPTVGIFSGTCDFLNCVETIAGSGYYGTPAVHEFHALEGETYRILLTGKTEATVGAYSLEVSEYALPENDECEDGIDIPFTPVARPGTTEGATSDVDLFLGELCGVSSSSRGVWYTLEGKGKIVRLEYAPVIRGNGLDPELSIFKGPCGFLECVINVEGSGYYGTPAIKEFHAEEGTLYRFLLSGKTFGAAGAYQFKVSDYDLPANDDCDDASDITTLPISYAGTTSGATSDFGGINDVCGIGLESRGVWYTLVGSGKIVRMEYSMVITGKNLHPELSVFTGFCGNLRCVENTEGDGYYKKPAIYELHALEGVKYYVLLSGKSFGVASGYQFQVSEYDHPVNDQCDDATSIVSLPLSTSGTTAGATSDFGGSIDLCGISVESRGVWYSLTGKGKIVRLEYNMQITGRGLDRELSVLTGSCGNLRCIENTEGSGVYNTAAIYEFLALEGETYYFLLSGKSFGVAGGYQFEVSEYELPVNDRCEDATSITSLPLSTTGTTDGATSDFGGTADVCGISVDSRGVWYTIVGNGTNVRLEYNMQVTGSRLDRELSVFTGSCGNLICLENAEGSGQYNTAAIQEFHAEEGVTYYILLSGKTFSVASGYQLEVSETL